MHLAWWIGGVGAWLATAALAAPGDALLVAGSNVNVRAGPSTEAGILVRVDRDAPAIERRRQGPWVEIDLPVQDVRGWIHGSLLTAAPVEPAEPRADATRGAAAVTPVATSPVTTGVTPETAPEVTPGTAPEITPEITNVAAVDPAVEDSGPLAAFRKDVERFNNGAVAAAGVDLFTGIAPLGEGGVRVVTTDAWATMAAPGQQSYLNALFGRWLAAAGDEQPRRLQIVDANGAVMLEKSGP